jgi:hypothetical protein
LDGGDDFSPNFFLFPTRTYFPSTLFKVKGKIPYVKNVKIHKTFPLKMEPFMKKWVFLALLLFSSSLMFADKYEKVETLSSKVVLQSGNGYFVFSDQSHWKAIGFSKRWRTLTEWWNDVQLVPENYECLPKDWQEGTAIEVYSKYGNLTVSEANASNVEELKQCTHLLVNTRTGQVLFAIALEPSNCLPMLFHEAKNEGYQAGYSQGYFIGHSNGYSTGYAAGRAAAGH